MTALAANKNIGEKEGKLIDCPVVNADIIYKGALVKHNAAGYIAPAAAEVGGVFAGIAFEKADNSAGSAGDISVRVQKTGLFLMVGTGTIAQTDIGQVAYASDDQTVSKTQGANEQAVGVFAVFVSATSVWVRIDGYAL
jgi:hypothetical protein